jgi:hypothetical protein
MNRRRFGGWVVAAVAAALTPLHLTAQEPTIEESEEVPAEIPGTPYVEETAPATKTPKPTATEAPAERTVPPDEELVYGTDDGDVVIATLKESGLVVLRPAKPEYYWLVRDLADDVGPGVAFQVLVEQFQEGG